MKNNPVLEKLNDEKQELAFDYSDILKTKEQKIVEEIRRRNQVYVGLDYMLSNVTYYDFFVHDTLQIIKLSSHFAKECKKQSISSEFILLAYLCLTDTSISKVLKKYNLNTRSVGSSITKLNNLTKSSILFRYKTIFKTNFDKICDLIFGTNDLLPEAITDNFMDSLNFSSDVDFLFEKAAENAIIRFKTPVVTPDILLITMMEEKGISCAKIIKKLIPKEIDWYLLRFTLLKSLHRKESILRTDVQINQRYFAYLLNIEYSDNDLEKIFENKLLTENILLFRNKLIKTTLEKNIFDLLAKDIHNSIEFNQSRVYKHI